MGQPKCWLPWQQTSLLNFVVSQLAPVCKPLVVAASADLTLPDLSSPVIVQRDARAYQGPLSGLITGFAGVPSEFESAIVTACDLPFLSSAVLQRLSTLWTTCPADALICSDGVRRHPLLGIYRRSVVAIAEQMLAEDQRRLLDLLERVKTAVVPPEELRAVDRELRCLRNLNSLADYAAALQQATQSP